MAALRVALAQLNVTVGDLEGNRHLIEQAIRQAKAWLADLVVVPELALTGYPPEDLLLKPQFVDANLRALARLTPCAQGIAALVGYVDRDSRGRLYNAAVVLSQGRQVATYRKQCLPNYGVFDEQRYFTPGGQPLLLELGGIRVGVTICEDLWEARPCQVLAASGAQAAVNLSASPYHAGKRLVRQRLFAQRARANRLALLYCNLVGGQDELVFDGASLALDARGQLLASGAQFRDDLLLVDVHPEHLAAQPRHGATASGRGPHGSASASGWAGCRPTRGGIIGTTPTSWGGAPQPRGRSSAVRLPHPLRERPPWPAVIRQPLGAVEEVYDALTLGVRDYFRKNGFSTAVLGLSGGVDSALTACVAADALGAAHVVGVVMPSRYSSAQTQEDARRLAHALGVALHEISIEPIFQAYLSTLKPFFRGRAVDVAEQNIQARIRGNLLMALSNKFGWLVLTTGNKSEMATGYCTLYGDMAGGFAVIKDVPKTLVYALARFRNRRAPTTEGRAPLLRFAKQSVGGKVGPIPERVLRRAPTAELAPNQTDQDTLPPYALLDRIVEAYVEEDRSLRQILQRNRVAPSVVRRVLQMVDRSEYKRRQGPPGIKITPKAFGKDRRMPITNRYHQAE